MTPQDIQAKLDLALNSLTLTTSSYAAMVKRYGPNWTTWPQNSNWYKALSAIKDARDGVGLLDQLTAKFTAKIL